MGREPEDAASGDGGRVGGSGVGLSGPCKAGKLLGGGVFSKALFERPGDVGERVADKLAGKDVRAAACGGAAAVGNDAAGDVFSGGEATGGAAGVGKFTGAASAGEDG